MQQIRVKEDRMKKTIVAALCLTLLAAPAASYAQNLLNNPESVVYDSTQNRYLVSNWGDGTIVQIDTAGNQTYYNTDFMGNHAFAGLHIDGDILYASCNVGPNRGLVAFDLATGDTLSVTFILGMSLLNDIATDTSGYLYVTEFNAHKLFRVKLSDKSFETFVDTGITTPNGIIFDEENNRVILIAENESGVPLVGIDLVTRSHTHLIYLYLGGCDGLTKDDDGNLYFSSWNTDRVYRINRGFGSAPTTASLGHNNPADIHFNCYYSELVVPNFNRNTIDIIPMDVGLFTRERRLSPAMDGGATQGVSWADYDSDGLQDLFVSNLSVPFDPEEDNGLYHNNGDGTFEKVSGDVVSSDGGRSRTGTWGDYDNDDDLDLFVSNWPDQANFLYQNQGDGSFTKVTDGEIVTEVAGSPAASWADFNRDGNLDLFVANCGHNSLFRNDFGTFTRMIGSVIEIDSSASYGASWSDFDGDGYPDLFVTSNDDNEANHLYSNDSGMAFTKVTGQKIVEDLGSAFGGSWGDYDNDGDMDLFVPNLMQSPPSNNLLYRNDGEGTFTRVTTGVVATDSGCSYSSAWGDYDNDGDLDLFVTNGMEGELWVNFLYENDGSGEFTRVKYGEVVLDQGLWTGAAWGDYDQDGDLDLFVGNTRNGVADNMLYRNNSSLNNWLNVKLVGTTSNRSAIGAIVRVKSVIDANPVWQMREISAQTGFCAQSSLNAHFGLGDAAMVDSIVVEWPSGIIQIITDTTVNQFLTITEDPGYTCGDADGSETVDIDDVVFLVNYIFGGGDPPDPLEAGDADCSEGVDIDDVVYLIAYIFSGGPEPCSDCS